MDLSRRPLRIAMIRHGESEANLDPTIFERVPDHAISLTERGRVQSAKSGRDLRELFENQPTGRSSAGTTPTTHRARTIRLVVTNPS